MRPLGDRQCEGCGKDYWRAQAWQHDGCVVVHPFVQAGGVIEVDNTVANQIPVVANKSKHGVYKDKESRLEYMRELMRKRRAKQRAA